MPTFFKKEELTTEQKARWDAAILEYSKVQERNVEHRLAALSNEERAYYVETHNASTDEQIKDQMREFSGLMGNPPGHEKSALFARLLDGKPALPFPPPTNHSYPWYSVIEGVGPHRARIGGAMTIGGMLKGAGGVHCEFAIGINQCQWAVKNCNAAAKTLMNLDEELQRVAKRPDPQSEFSSIYDWPEELLRRVKDAYADGPEFIVQHGNWPAYRLFVTQLSGTDDCHRSQKKYAREKMLGSVRHLKRTGSVFDLDALDLNARIGNTLSKGVHPEVRLQEAQARYADLLANHTKSSFPVTAQFDKAAADQQLASLEADVRDFEANPDNNDWVELFLDQWYLERMVANDR